jgi:anti-sigma-K factor RskA
MAGFTRLPEAQAYQLWAVRDGVWLRIGICNTNEQGGWMGDFQFSVREGEQIALTIEPAEGSEKPTSEPLLASNF